nr:hypothetical protein [Klebsiella pneumoniae]
MHNTFPVGVDQLEAYPVELEWRLCRSMSNFAAQAQAHPYRQ